jgi:DHA2 family multidrug resistance protein
MAAPSANAIIDQPARPTHKWLVAAALMLGAILQSLDSSIINVALPYMQKSLHVGVDQITWVVTSYLVAISVVLPLSGWIAARVGRKRYLVASVVLFVIASALCGLAQTIGQIVLFRVIQGATGAAVMPLTQAILLETFPPAEHTLAMTTLGMGVMVAPVLGPTVGGWITMNWSWRWNFYINVPTGAMAALMVYAFVHDPPYLRQQRGSGRVDYLGILLITMALGLSQIILGRGGISGWFEAPWVRYATIASALSFVLLVFHELRFPEPVLDLRIFKIFGFTLSVIIISLQALALFSINLLNPLFMETILGYDAWKAGLAVAPRGIGVIIALIAVGQLSRRGIRMQPIITGGFILGAYEVWRMSQWSTDITMRAVLLPIFLFGMGLGAGFPTVTALGIGQIRRERMGFAASLFGMMVNTGAASGIAIVTTALTARQQSHQAQLTAYFASLDVLRKTNVLPGMPSIIAPGSADHLINGTIRSQAWLMAYNDVYRALAVVVLLVAPLCLLLKQKNDGIAKEAVLDL